MSSSVERANVHIWFFVQRAKREHWSEVDYELVKYEVADGVATVTLTTRRNGTCSPARCWSSSSTR